MNWDGAANTDPIARMHALIERVQWAPLPIILSPIQYQRVELECLLAEGKATYRVRLHARAFLFAAHRRHAERSRSFPWGPAGPAATANHAIERALALETP